MPDQHNPPPPTPSRPLANEPTNPPRTPLTTPANNTNNPSIPPRAPTPAAAPSSRAPSISADNPPPPYQQAPDPSPAAPAAATPSSYRGFPSEGAYLTALHQWAEEQKYFHAGATGVEGLYGGTTMEEYARRARGEVGWGLGRKLRGRRWGEKGEGGGRGR